MIYFILDRILLCTYKDSVTFNQGQYCFPDTKKSAFLINSHEEQSLEWLMSNCKRHQNDNVMHSITHLTNIQVVYHKEQTQ